MPEEIIKAEVIGETTTELVATFKAPAIVDNVEALSSWVDQQIAPFIGAQIDSEDSEQVSQARKLCAALNKLADPIDKERKRVKKEYQKPINAFDERVQAVIRKIKDARADLNDQVKEADAMFKDRRLVVFRDEYDAIAGDLANVIPIEALLDNEWFQRSKSEIYGLNKLAEKAEKALQGYKNLREQNFNHKQEVLHEYCMTLDTQKALAVENELNQRDQEMAAFEAAQVEAGLIKEPEIPQIIEAEIPPLSKDPSNYRFTLSIPMAVFVTNINEAKALKQHLELLGIDYSMTKSTNPVEVVEYAN